MGVPHSERGGKGLEADSRGVAQVPEPLSPRYRSRVREVSASYRSHGVNHEPEPHTIAAEPSGPNADHKQRKVVDLDDKRASDLDLWGVDQRGIEPLTSPVRGEGKGAPHDAY